jgi:glyoxylase I family protein
MKPLAIHHITIEVRELESALAFYRDRLGMTVLPRPEFEIPGYWLGCGEQEVHLVQTDDGHANKIQHFALVVSDRAALVKSLKAAGIAIEEDEGMLFVYDSSRNRVELVQASI